MSSVLLTVLKNVVIWFLLVLFLGVPLVILKLVKTFIILCARILHPSLRPFQTRDALAISDRLYIKPLSNIGIVLKTDGRISLNEFQAHFYKTLLEPINRATRRRVNRNLLRFYKLFWGYAFMHDIKLSDINLNDLIYEYSLRNGETFSDFSDRFFYAPYEEGKPLWSIALLHGVDPSDLNNSFGGTTLLCRLHHSMGDGYSLMYLFEQLAGNVSCREMTTKSKWGIWEKMRLFLCAPTTMLEFHQKMNSVPNTFPMSGNNTKVRYAFFTLELDAIKRIRAAAEVHVTPILLALLGSVLRRILSELHNGDTSKLPECIYTGHALPWPTHPRNQMCNEWILGFYRVPIENPNALERLYEIERNYVDFHAKGIHKILKLLILPIVSLIPIRMVQRSSEADGSVGTSWSPLMAGNDYRLMGHKVENAYPFIGISLPKTAVVTSSLSHSGSFDVMIGVNQELVGDLTTFNRITKEFFPEELQNLIKLVEA